MRKRVNTEKKPTDIFEILSHQGHLTPKLEEILVEEEVKQKRRKRLEELTRRNLNPQKRAKYAE